jgi:hypothetical protein
MLVISERDYLAKRLDELYKKGYSCWFKCPREHIDTLPRMVKIRVKCEAGVEEMFEIIVDGSIVCLLRWLSAPIVYRCGCVRITKEQLDEIIPLIMELKLARS